MVRIPDVIDNWIKGAESAPQNKSYIDKYNPATGTLLTRVARSAAIDVNMSVDVAKQSQMSWAAVPPVQRGMVLHEIVVLMQKRKEEIAEIVSLETGKSMVDALGETEGAIQCALFYASEGQRLYGKTCTSGAANKYAMTVRQPVGVAGLIIAANTPIANVAWKLFPALICGNSVVMKTAEDTPVTTWLVAQICRDAGLPDGVFNVIQGLGEEAGAPLVAHDEVGVVSFTGSTAVGRIVAEVAGKRLAKISLELGGKNPLVVCDDADLQKAVDWVMLSAFSNAGQRCASCGRVIVFSSVYDSFKKLLLEKVEKITVGISDTDYYGPVINLNQLNNMLSVVHRAEDAGATILSGGKRMVDEEHKDGYFFAPTVIEGVEATDEISQTELFGPVACLYMVNNFAEALDLANNSPYGLTSCIHTRNVNRAIEFSQKIQAGVVVVNGGTYGSEPHMPFGGVKQSGNGSREPGTEALDIYSDLKDIYLNVDQTDL